MGKGSLRAKRMGLDQPKTRNMTAVDAHMRNSAGTMEKRGKGRTRKDTATRSAVKHNLKAGVWA